MTGVVDLKRLRNDAFRVAGARISCFAMSMFEAPDAESMEGLHVTEVLLHSDHFAWQLQEFVCLGSTFFVAGAVLWKHPLKNR